MGYTGTDYYFLVGTRTIEVFDGENGAPVWQNAVYDKDGVAIVEEGDPVRAIQTNIPGLFGQAVNASDTASLSDVSATTKQYLFVTCVTNEAVNPLDCLTIVGQRNDKPLVARCNTGNGLFSGLAPAAATENTEINMIVAGQAYHADATENFPAGKQIVVGTDGRPTWFGQANHPTGGQSEMKVGIGVGTGRLIVTFPLELKL